MSSDSTKLDSRKTSVPAAAKSVESGIAPKISEAQKMWGTIFLVLIAATLYIVPSIFAMFLLYGLFGAFGQSPAQAKEYFDSTKGQFALTAVVELAAIALVRLYMHFTHDTWQSIGLTKPKLNALVTLAKAALAYYILLIISGVLIQIFTSINTEQPQDLGFDTSTSGLQLIMVFFGLVVLPPIAEEIMFRGFLYTRFKKYYSVIGSALWVSLLFCFAHLQLGNGAPPLWAAAIDTFILSMILVYLREKTGSIIPGMGLHALKNGIAFIMLFFIN